MTTFRDSMRHATTTVPNPHDWRPRHLAARKADAMHREIERIHHSLVERMPQPPAPWEGEFSMWKAVARWGYLYKRALLAQAAADANPWSTSPNSAAIAAGARHKRLENNKSARKIPYGAWTFYFSWKESSGWKRHGQTLETTLFFDFASITTRNQKTKWHAVAVEKGFQEVDAAGSPAQRLEVSHCPLERPR